MMLRFNYMFYNGYKTIQDSLLKQESFTPENFFYEIYFNTSIGGKRVRFESGFGLSLKNLGEIGEGIKVFPMHFDLGMLFIFGRKYE
jgi:hypothetical protein